MTTKLNAEQRELKDKRWRDKGSEDFRAGLPEFAPGDCYAASDIDAWFSGYQDEQRLLSQQGNFPAPAWSIP